MSAFTEWQETRLKNLFVSIRNGVWGDDPDGETDVSCARGTDFDRLRNRISDSKMPRRSVTPDVLRDHQLRCGDRVLRNPAAARTSPSVVSAMFDLQIRAVCSNFNARLQVCDSADSRFVCYLMNSLYSSEFTRQFVKQTTGIQNLDANAFLAQHCVLPPLDEQRRIADFLDAQTARIDSLTSTYARARNVLLERRMTWIFNAATGYEITDRVPSKLAWVKSLPRTWQSVKLGHFARMGSGHTPSRSRPDWWENCTIPWITTGTIYVPDLQALRIPLPPLAEQQAIVALIRSSNSVSDAAVDVIDRQLALLAERRRAVITAAVTGQIDMTTAGGLALAGGAI